MKNNSLVKANLAMMVVLGTLGFAGAANAAKSTKAIVLGWSGTIPSAPAAGGDWKFVDILNPSVDYVPTVGNLVINNGVTAGTKSLDMEGFRFGIKATTTSLKASSTIGSYLAYGLTFSGLNATSGTAAAPSGTISVNGIPVGVGAANAVTVSTIGSTAVTEAVPMNVTGKGTLPDKSYSAGDSVNVSATLMFTAEV
ncbi:hypothetical protein [Aeromonas jandaei]|uniref:hypothetical protein n=1 Tax=Aeromonas jandaei TaxID=650 RepID=UPI003BA38AD1